MANISEINGFGINAVSASYATTASYAENGGGGGGTVYQYMGFRSVLTMASNGATYIPIYGLYPSVVNQANDTTNFDARSMVLTRDTTFTDITVSTNTSQAGTGDLNVYLSINDVETSLVCNIPAGSAAGHYSGSSLVSASAGDKIAFYYDNSASSNSAVMLAHNLTMYTS